MKSFRFRLERVLSWRRTQLALEEAALETLRADLRAIETAVADLARRDPAAMSAKSHSFISGPDIAVLARFREWAAREEKNLRSRLLECKRQIEQRSLSVREANRKVRLTELLKERKRESWDSAVNRELEQLAGESAVSVWRRDRLQSQQDDWLGSPGALPYSEPNAAAPEHAGRPRTSSIT
jgi:flagellar export protein FliJ